MVTDTGLDTLDDHLLLEILGKLDDEWDRKSWRLTCRQFYTLDVESRKSVRLFNVELLPQVLRKYSSVQRLDLSFCTRITDRDLVGIAELAANRLHALSLLRLGGFTIAGITALARACRCLLEVDLSCCSNVGSLELAALSQLSSLKKLNLTGCCMITDAGLGCLAAGCKLLEVIILKACVGISDAGLCLLASNCRELAVVDVAFTEITDNALTCLSSLARLKTMNLSGCSNVSDAGLQHTSTALVNLDLSRCKKVTSVGISYLSERAIESLKLCYMTQITVDFLKAIGRLSKLRSLKLAACDISGEGLHFIGSGCTQLRELSLSKCRGVTDQGISFILSRCKSLTTLDLTCCRDLTENTVNSIANSCCCQSVTSLMVETSTVISDGNFRLLTERCSSLEQLDLTDCAISDTGLQRVAKCGSLKLLKLGFCDVTDAGIRHIGTNCHNLTELDLYRSGSVSDLGVACIATGCLKLRVLILSYCPRISDACLPLVSQLKQLQQLEVRGCKGITLAGLDKTLPVFRNLIELDLKHCSIGDPGVTTIIERFPNVQQLNISYCPITNGGLVSIAKLNCLRNLKLALAGNVSLECISSTLLACPCLKKAKMLFGAQVTVPKHVYQRLEGRGCRLRCMHKPGHE